MKRGLAFSCSCALAAIAHPAVATAQTVSFFVAPDTALTILTNATGTVPLVVTGVGGVSQYALTVFLDRTRVNITAVDAAAGSGLPAPSMIAYADDSLTLAASGSGSTATSVILASVTFSMAAGATQGSLVSLRLNTLIRASDGSNGVPTHRTIPLDVCQAVEMRGDVTGERVVNSRDALVVLTAAVGLPVAPYDPAGGDADGDLEITSRDALFIMSYGIGLATPQAPNLGKGIPNACGPLSPVPGDLLFLRANALYRVSPGDTVPRPVFLPILPYVTYRPRWSPDRSRILYTAYTGAFDYEVLSADTLGGVVDTLTRNGAFDFGADWSPDGSRIAFGSNRVSPASVYLMNANGSGQVRVTTNITVNTNEAVAWSPDGTRLAFVGCQTCGNYGIWTVAPDGSALTEVLPGTAGQDPSFIDWNAAGDSLAYRTSAAGTVYRVAAKGNSVGEPAEWFVGSAYYPAAASTGLGFQARFRFPYDYYLRRAADGRTLRLVRGSASDDGAFSFRRTGTYVDQVTISPTADTLSVSGSNGPVSALFTATVTNKDGSPASVPLSWISRDPAAVSVDVNGMVTAVGISAGVYVVVTAGGWRSDSALVRVDP